MQANFRNLFSIVFCICCLSAISLSGVAQHDRFVVVTPPKAGTHLLIKAMEKLTGKTGQSIFSSYELVFEEWKIKLAEAEKKHAFIQMHAHPNPQQVDSLRRLGYKVIFLIRDPRDQAVSLFFFIQQKHWSLGALNGDREPYKSLSSDDKLDEIITGSRTGCSGVQKLFARYVPWAWQGPDFVLTIRFEDLVGEEGGGTRQNQLDAVTKIAKFLRMPISAQAIEQRSQGLFGKPGEKTFRKGQIGEWRKYFKFRHRHEMVERFGDLMKEFGYE